MANKLCALVIGHKQSSPGAINENDNLTEFDFNKNLAVKISNTLNTVDFVKVYRTTYKELPSDINRLHPDFIISLHCNAFNKKASGTEVLYYHTSKNGKRMAKILQDNLVRCLNLPDRGIKGITAEDRGGYLLKYTAAPCIIAEPFFIDNNSDLSTVRAKLSELVDTYAKSIEEMSIII